MQSFFYSFALPVREKDPEKLTQLNKDRHCLYSETTLTYTHWFRFQVHCICPSTCLMSPQS